jgi:hypothetical protein
MRLAPNHSAAGRGVFGPALLEQAFATAGRKKRKPQIPQIPQMSLAGITLLDVFFFGCRESVSSVKSVVPISWQDRCVTPGRRAFGSAMVE